MKKSLIDVLFLSEKRKNVLLSLKDGTKEMEYLLQSLDTTRQALLPHIKILNDAHLIRRVDDSYKLTTIGKLIVDDMVPLLGTINLLDPQCSDYMGTHYLDFIPPRLLKRLRELEKCTFVEVSLLDLFEIDNHFFEEARKSKYLYMVTSFMFPMFDKIFLELIAEGVDISIIISKELYQRLIQDSRTAFQGLVSNPNISFYQYPDNFKFLSLSLTDHSILLRLLTEEGNHDNKRIMFSSNSARDWGKELFEYYLKDSTPITEL